MHIYTRKCLQNTELFSKKETQEIWNNLKKKKKDKKNHIAGTLGSTKFHINL